MRFRLRLLAILLPALLVQGCVEAMPGMHAAPDEVQADPRVVMLSAVAARIDPMAEDSCHEIGVARRCRFTFALADDLTLPPNAFQTLDDFGRPVIVVTMGLLRLARTPDELAFVLGHEAAHHVLGHIPRRQEQALGGAVMAGAIARAAGMSGADIAAAQDIGAEIAANQYSREFELEADALGARIALAAGFDPVKGTQLFWRLPDPGIDGTESHPSIAQRIAVVRKSVADARAEAARKAPPS